MNAHNYRPDIDGLRTIAVLAVVVFHAFPHALPGGFVGVDVFFVISGYLISSLLIEDHHKGRYSIRQFYSRRIRRIFPALLTVMLFSLALGWLVLTADEYEQLGKHVAGGAAFLANFIFNREAGYFDNAADTKPMLHLWSLGVEEQFYIVWPLLLPFLLKRESSRLRWFMFCVLTLASLFYSMAILSTKPSLAFYSPVSRFWELAAGAGLAMALRRRSTEVPGAAWVKWSQFSASGSPALALMSLAGLAAVLAAVALYSEATRFPGLAAALPVAGTVLMIAAGPHNTLNRILLANRGMVFVGLISYPLYLWHWPLLSFARILESQTPSVALRGTLVLLTFVLAWLTYRFIEQPLRRRNKSRGVLVVLSVLMVLVFAGALYIKKKDGLAFRHHGLLNADPATLDLGKGAVTFDKQCGLEAQNESSARNANEPADKAVKKADFQYCLQAPGGPANLALYGDSKGEALLYGLLAEAKPGQRWMLIGSVNAPALGAPLDAKQQAKSQTARDLIIQSPNIKTVVLSIALRSIFAIDAQTGYPNQPAQFDVRLGEYTDLIQSFEAAGKRVAFFMDNPTFPDPKSCISGGMTRYETLNGVLRRAQNPRCQTDMATYRQGVDLYIRFVNALKQRFPDLRVIDPLPQLCNADGQCSVTDAGVFLYSYSDHLSLIASRRIAKVHFSNF